jgi:ribosomal protein L16 Arg81 hydroxylase
MGDNGMTLTDLDSLLAPLSGQQFIDNHWGKSYCYVPGHAAKFASLFSWDHFSAILQSHRLDSSRLRVVQAGRATPAEQYTISLQCRGRDVPRLLADDIMRLFRDGHTIAVNWVDETHPQLGALADQLGARLCAHVFVNAYASLKQSPGFRPHYDDHDVLVLQVAGRKEWRVFGTTGLHPLTAATDAMETIPTEIEWGGVLNEGDALYLPRGCWHTAAAIGEPTLHLSVGIYPPTGVDLMMWMVSGAASNALLRRDLPLLQASAARAEHLAKIKAVFDSVWSNNILSTFLEQYTACLGQARRPRFKFPFGVESAEAGQTAVPTGALDASGLSSWISDRDHS